MTDLGALAPGCRSAAFAINASGVVVGSSQTSPGGPYHAVIWQAGVITDLGVLPGNNSSTGVDINDAAQVVATSYTNTVNQTTDFRGFLWQDGVAVDLGSLGGGSTSPHAINNLGQVIGTSATLNGSHAFLWQAGSLVDLGTLGGNFSIPFEINGSGQVVGWASDSTGTTQSFVWQSGTMTSLPTLGGGSAHSRLYINGQGQVAGTSVTQTGIRHAALWTVLAAPPTFALTASAGDRGSISPSGSTTVTIGANQTYSISPNPYYHVADVVVDGASVGPVTSYTSNNVAANHTISASFVLVNIAISSPTAQSVWARGTDHTITWTYINDPGKVVKIELLAQGSVVDVINNGVSIGKNGSGSYKWHIPAKLSPGYYQIKVTSKPNAQYSDTSAEFAVPF